MTSTNMLIGMSGTCNANLRSPYNSVRIRFFTVGGASGPGLYKPTDNTQHTIHNRDTDEDTDAA